MKKVISAVLVGSMLLAGCSSITTVPAETVKDISGDTKEAVVNFSDEHTARLAIIGQTLRNRDIQYRKAYEASGSTVEFSVVKLDSGQQIIMPKVTFKEAPRFETPLPQQPANHPGWQTTEGIVKSVVTGAIVWHGIDGLAGVLGKAAATKTGDITYNGPVNMTQSQNTAGGAQTFDGSGGAYHINSDNPVTETPAAETTTIVTTP